MENKRLFLNIHAIQTLPPSNVNRDDSGSPKTAKFGGVKRARVSSQCWKKAIRDYFYANYDISNKGIRTTQNVEILKNKILDRDKSLNEKEAGERATDIIKTIGISIKNDTTDSSSLFFISGKQSDELADFAISEKYKKLTNSQLATLARDIVNKNISVDMALFGRMLATSDDKNSVNVEAAAQVSHAISTHAVNNEFDFYVATDDFQKEKQGASMLGVIEFNSSTMYRYANIALHQFINDIGNGDEFVNGVRMFLDAFINSMPTGKINSFGNQTFPEAIIISLREDAPLNLSDAFEDPVVSKNGYTAKSIERLFDGYEKWSKAKKKPLMTNCFVLRDNENLKDIPNRETNIDELIEKVTEEVRDYFKA